MAAYENVMCHTMCTYAHACECYSKCIQTVRSRSDGGRFMALVLHVRRDEISAVHFQSSGRDSRETIRMYAFHQSC